MSKAQPRAKEPPRTPIAYELKEIHWNKYNDGPCTKDVVWTIFENWISDGHVFSRAIITVAPDWSKGDKKYWANYARGIVRQVLEYGWVG